VSSLSSINERYNCLPHAAHHAKLHLLRPRTYIYVCMFYMYLLLANFQGPHALFYLLERHCARPRTCMYACVFVCIYCQPTFKGRMCVFFWAAVLRMCRKESMCVVKIVYTIDTFVRVLLDRGLALDPPDRNFEIRVAPPNCISLGRMRIG
jgi:hypothetical protein